MTLQTRTPHTNQFLRWLVLSCAIAATGGYTVGQDPISADEGLSHVRWHDADQVVGSVAIVSGRVVNTGQFGRVSFLNFDEARRDVFKVVVFEEHLQQFPNPLKELYDQQLVMVRGHVTLYKNVPQIQVTSMEQIQIISELSPTKLLHSTKRTVGKRTKIATFNIRNLFDAVDDPYYMDETTKAKPRHELERAAETIRGIGADVVALQEVESRGYLQRFVDVFLRDMGYSVVHFSGNDRRGSGLAMLTRVPVGAVTSNRHRRFPRNDAVMTRFSRDLLCVEFLPATGQPFEVWVTHLKSKRGGPEQTEPQRLAEAVEIRRMLDERLRLNPTATVVLVGDFNDTINSKPITALIGQGQFALVSFVKDLPTGVVTYNLSPYQEMIDFIFCTQAAARGYVSQSYEISHATLQQSGSDHNPVAAEFDF